MRGKFFVGVAFLAIFLLGFFFHRAFFSPSGADPCTSDLTFIKPNLDCNLSDEKAQNFSTLEEKLKEDIAGYKQRGGGDPGKRFCTRPQVFAFRWRE